jgi:hypothetical protein
MTAWTRVADQLPPPGVDVLAAWQGHPTILIGRWRGDKWRFPGVELGRNPTHWMLLPPPPEVTP